VKHVIESRLVVEAGSLAIPELESADVSEQILDMIRDRNLRAGDRLPTEAETARVLSLPRQKVRAGFLSLESQGIVRSRQGSGRVLLDRTHHTLPALLGTGIGHTNAELLDAVLVRQVLEVGFLPAACDAIEPSALDRMEEAVASMTAKAELGEPFAEYDRAFHDALFSGLDNQLLSSLLNTFWDLLEGVDLAVLRHREAAEETIRHHRNILDAVRRHEAAVAQFHLATHFYDSVESLRDLAESAADGDQ
jgi:DNA-binding FadR family transcriptional regulator